MNQSVEHSEADGRMPQAPNFVWKTTDFPAAKKGYLWCIILQVLSSESMQPEWVLRSYVLT